MKKLWNQVNVTNKPEVRMRSYSGGLPSAATNAKVHHSFGDLVSCLPQLFCTSTNICQIEGIAKEFDMEAILASLPLRHPD